MHKRLILFVILLVSGIFVWQNAVQAGFGISPPFIKTKNPIFPGSHFEQTITLLRSASGGDLQARISIDAPEIADWMTINQGELIDLPAGQLQIPMLVEVDVPESADVGHYTGHINVQIVPKDEGGGGVAIALGARIDIDLEITNEEFVDFLIRSVKIPDIEELKKPWNWPIFSWFFYRIKVVMKVENIGNVEIAPSKVELDLYDLAEKNLLESHKDKRIKKIEPFSEGTVFASFPTKLVAGEYWGRVRIYNGDEIVHQDKLIFAIFTHGSLPGGTDLGKNPWLLMGLYVLIILIILAILIKIRIWRYIFKLIYILSWPLRVGFSKIKALIKGTKKWFWQWMYRKSAKYQASKEINKEQENRENSDDRINERNEK